MCNLEKHIFTSFIDYSKTKLQPTYTKRQCHLARIEIWTDYRVNYVRSLSRKFCYYKNRKQTTNIL